MNMSELWNSVTFADLTALFGTLSLVVGGAALIASSIPMRAEAGGAARQFGSASNRARNG